MKKRIFPDAAHNSYVEKEWAFSCVCSLARAERAPNFPKRHFASPKSVVTDCALADLRSAFWRVIDRSIGIEAKLRGDTRVYGDTVDSPKIHNGFRAQLSAGKAPVHRETRWKPQQHTIYKPVQPSPWMPIITNRLGSNPRSDRRSSTPCLAASQKISPGRPSADNRLIDY